MNNYEISFMQNYPDRNGRIYDETIRRRMLEKYMNSLTPDKFKKLNIEIEEVE